MSTPGWGRPHTHEYKPTAKIGTLIIERCACGKVKHVIDLTDNDPPESTP